MPRLTKPGISDLHWQVTVITPAFPIARTFVSFYETEDDAKNYARTQLETPRTSVYVSQVMHHGEHLRRAGGK